MRKKLTRATARGLWFEHGLPLLLFASLSVAFSWPTIRHFTTSITSSGTDARHLLWTLWHWKEALLGREPWYYTQLLFYPLGITLLTHATGPLQAVLATPFWLWGPEAAYNGALLTGLCLTGYLMYLLARSLGLRRGVALFAGVVLATAEIPLSAQWGHVSKTFLGLLPLALLTVLQAVNPRRSRWWAGATACVLLLALLHSGWQFVLAAAGVGFFGLAGLLSADRVQRTLVWRRLALLAVCSAALVGPLLLAILDAASNPAITVDFNVYSLTYQPDAIEFVLPSRLSRLFGSAAVQFLQSRGITWSIETTVSLTWTGIALALLALVRGDRRARLWWLFAAVIIILSLGPRLKVLGRTHYTEYGLPIIMPYAILTALPGFQFMRTPGRFMMIGFVGWGVVASYGLAWLTRRLPRKRQWVIALAIALVLIETWPAPWPSEELQPVPEFYQRIAEDREVYGVFDLPIEPQPNYWYAYYASDYQMFQMTHRKGIAAGYLSRIYDQHPIFPHLFSTAGVPADVLANGRPLDPHANFLYELARHNYRYVVWHKPRQGSADSVLNSFDQQDTRALVQAVFGEQPPLLEDEWATVYPVAPLTDAAAPTLAIELGNNWHEREGEWRWASSPATLKVTSPRRQPALLHITPGAMHSPVSSSGAGTHGVLTVQSHGGFAATVEMAIDQAASLPVELVPGVQTITLTLAAGNFRPLDYGEADPRALSFSIRSIDLRTLDHSALPADITVDGQAQDGGGEPILAAYGAGWYEYEPDVGRWGKSPAELWVYSAAARPIEWRVSLRSLYAPGSPDAQGEEGTIQVLHDGEATPGITLRGGQPGMTALTLHEGWNRVVLWLEAGSFRPSELAPGTGDDRQLSFALTGIDIVTTDR